MCSLFLHSMAGLKAHGHRVAFRALVDRDTKGIQADCLVKVIVVGGSPAWDCFIEASQEAHQTVREPNLLACAQLAAVLLHRPDALLDAPHIASTFLETNEFLKQCFDAGKLMSSPCVAHTPVFGYCQVTNRLTVVSGTGWLPYSTCEQPHPKHNI